VKTFPRLETSMAGMRGSPLACTDQNILEWGLGIIRHAAAVQSQAGTFKPARDKCCTNSDGDSSLTQGFVGSTVLVGHRSCHNNVGGVVHIEHWEHGSLVQQGSPLVFLVGVLLVCTWHRSLVDVAPASPTTGLTLDGGVGVIGVTPHWSRSFIVLWRAQ
jgi:hypothetical protein